MIVILSEGYGAKDLEKLSDVKTDFYNDKCQHRN